MPPAEQEGEKPVFDLNPIHSFVYSKLVRGDEDLVGFVGYSLYKKAKVAFILEAAAAGRRPSSDELLGFHRTNSLPQTIESYRQQAEELLAAFGDGVLTGQTAEIESAYSKNWLRSFPRRSLS